MTVYRASSAAPPMAADSLATGAGLAPAEPAAQPAATPVTAEDSAGYHVAFFTNTYRPFVGGVAISVDLYQRYLNKLGDRVIVYAPEYDEATVDGEETRRLPAIRHFNNTDFSFPLSISFKPVTDFTAEAFDVVHVHHPFLLGELGMRLARQHRLPLVFTYHTQYEQYTHYVPFNQELAARTIVRHTVEFCNRCDLVIAPTSDIEKMLRARGVTARIAVLPTGIELPGYAAADRGALRRELDLPAETPILVHVGRLAVEKNLPFLLTAALRALAAAPQAHLVIAGEGPLQAELEALVGAAGEPGRRVHFLGRRCGAALLEVYAGGDLFIFASKSETQGMVIAEAQGGGLPAVALDAPGVRELVHDGVTGRLLAGDADEEALGAAILAALRDGPARAAWRERALDSARTLDMNLLARKLHENYRALKTLPNHRLKQEPMSFGLIRNYFETVWEELESWFTKL